MSLWFSVLRLRNRAVPPLRFTFPRPNRNSRTLRNYSDVAVPLPMTKVEKIVLDSIKATGPIPFATYMQLCLSHPTDGYYMNPSNPVFGSRGDFTTSPEISQVFGELVGIWLLSQWMNAGRPPAIRLIELGPGRGTLMDDILRVIAQFTKGGKPLKDIHLVETSRAMRSLQEEKLRGRYAIHWHDSIDDVPLSDSYSMVIAHEFFDALPFYLLQKSQQGWHEVMVASNEDSPSQSQTNPEAALTSISTIYPRLRRVLSPKPTIASTTLGFSSPRFHNLPIGASIEVSPSSFKIARKIGELLSRSNETGDGTERSPGGCGLIIDYGGAKAFGNSFRAFKEHKIVDVFHQPGECDLTANVDFAFLQEAMSDLVETHGPLPQSTFLERMGLQLRVDALVKNATTEERGHIIRDAAKRLVDRSGMGSEYQVMGITKGRSGAEPSGDSWPFVEVNDAKSQTLEN